MPFSLDGGNDVANTLTGGSSLVICLLQCVRTYIIHMCVLITRYFPLHNISSDLMNHSYIYLYKD